MKNQTSKSIDIQRRYALGYFQIIITAFLLLSLNKIHAQDSGSANSAVIGGTISGTITDSLSRLPVDYATISIFRLGSKSPFNGTITDSIGKFKITNIQPGDYTITIVFIGYVTKSFNLSTTASKPAQNLGNILLSPASSALKEVVIAGQKSVIENHIDKIVYNAEKDLTAAGGNAADLLQKVPLVAVDINGNVSLRGDGNVLVLINGKPSGATSDNLSDVLKTIPAAQIKSIEVITSPSAKYDSEGTAGIINIITKQKNVSGISGSLTGGVGTRQNNGNFNLNYNKNKFSLTVNIGGNLSWPQTLLTNFNQQFLNNNATVQTLDKYNSSTLKRYGTISSVSGSYNFNSSNSINSTFRLSKTGYSVSGNSLNSFNNLADPSQNMNYSGRNISSSPLSSFDWNIDYTHKFIETGREIDLSAQWSRSDLNTTYTNIYSTQSISSPNQQANNSGTNNEYTLQADYVSPFSKSVKLEAGGKAIFRKINSDFNLYKPMTSAPGDSSNFVLDPVNSNLYDYNQNVYSAYTVLTIALPNGFTLLPGARLENTTLKGDPINSLQTNLTPFTQNYITFIPGLIVQKALTPTQTIKLSYTKRISRPSLTYLNPFLNATNPNSQLQGNPELAPESTQTVELNYNTYIKSSIINISAYYKHTTGLIEGIATPLDNTGIGIITHYFNIGKNNSFGTSLFASVNPISIITLRASINAYTYQEQANAQFVNKQSQNGNFVAYNGFVSASVNLKSGVTAEIFGYENSKQHTLQGTTQSLSILGVGIKKQIFNKRASIGVNILEPFNEYLHFDTHVSSPAFIQNSSSLYPYRSFGLTFSYSFGKLSFSNQQEKKGVKNDDLKPGEQNGPAAPISPY